MNGIVEGRIRRWLLILSVLSFGVTVVELILQEHTGEPLQLLPFALCGIGIVAVLAVLLRPGRSTIVMMRITMLIVGMGGVLGLAVHLLRNIGFEQEIRPNAATLDVVLNALKGASPLLAPGAIVFAALLGIIAAYEHPRLGQPQQ